MFLLVKIQCGRIDICTCNGGQSVIVRRSDVVIINGPMMTRGRLKPTWIGAIKNDLIVN